MPRLRGAGARIAITDDGNGVAHALADSLNKLGCRSVVMQNSTDVGEIDGLIFLGGLRLVATFEDAVGINRDAFHWAKSVGHCLQDHGGIFVTVQDTGGDFGRSGQTGIRAWLGGLSGLVKTAGLEWPQVAVKAIDVEQNSRSAESLADAILRELIDGGPETEVGLKANGRRVTLVARPDAGNARPVNEDQEAVIVVSGGARGVTAAVIKELAKFTKPRIALLGRSVLVEEPVSCRDAVSEADITTALLADAKSEGISPTPRELGKRVKAVQTNREIVNTLNHLRRVTPHVRFLSVDVQDERAVSEALSSVRQTWGAITGLVHGAGVIHDKRIVDKTAEAFDDVFQTKVQGLQSLLSATECDDLNLICLFSSMAARTGNLGQSDYAMANEVLNTIAWHEANRRGPNCIVKSINWGAWAGGMVTPSLRAHFEDMGVPLISLDDGARFFVDEIHEADPHSVELVAAPDIAGWLGKGSHKTWELELFVGQETFPALRDHTIDQTPVVPVAFVLDWFVRAATACRRDLVVQACERVQVVKGIQLSDFQQRIEVLSLMIQETSDEQGIRMDMTLKGQSGTLHYRGMVRMCRYDEDRHQHLEELMPGRRVQTSPDERFTTLYPTHLFHGPAFQVIDSIDGVSDEGVLATLRTNPLQSNESQFDDTFLPMLLDGGLQAARVWGIHVLGQKTLPTAIARYVPGPGRALPGHCVVIAQSVTPLKTVSDVFFTTQDGSVVAALFGVEMHTYKHAAKGMACL